MIRSLDHVQLAMPKGEEEKAREFYVHLLGLIEIPKPPILAARGGVWFRLVDGFELHLGVEEPFSPARKAHPGLVSLDVQTLAQNLIEAGYPVTWDTHIPELRRFYSLDPFGNRLEFR